MFASIFKVAQVEMGQLREFPRRLLLAVRVMDWDIEDFNFTIPIRDRRSWMRQSKISLESGEESYLKAAGQRPNPRSKAGIRNQQE